VNLERIRQPVLIIYAERDHIVPPSAVMPLRRYISSRDYTEDAVDTGHIGLYVSRRAQEYVPGRIASWLRQRA
jgi:polyhydroxyalkanoate synthase